MPAAIDKRAPPKKRPEAKNKTATPKKPVETKNKTATRGPFVKMWNRTRTYEQCMSCLKTKCAKESSSAPGRAKAIADCSQRRCKPWAKDAIVACKALNKVECSNGEKVACAALKSVRKDVPKSAAAMNTMLKKLWAVRSSASSVLGRKAA